MISDRGMIVTSVECVYEYGPDNASEDWIILIMVPLCNGKCDKK